MLVFAMLGPNRFMLGLKVFKSVNAGPHGHLVVMTGTMGCFLLPHPTHNTYTGAVRTEVPFRESPVMNAEGLPIFPEDISETTAFSDWTSSENTPKRKMPILQP